MLQRLGDWSDVCALGLPCQKGQARKLIKNVGIDIGSTTVKVVVMEGDRVLYRVYQRHLSQVRQATLRALEGAKQFLDGPFQVAISGSAGLGLAEDAGVRENGQRNVGVIGGLEIIGNQGRPHRGKAVHGRRGQWKDRIYGKGRILLCWCSEKG